LVAILDAKYRDLWEKRLPRDMLYQLVVYAVSNRQLEEASILYPTLSELATEAQVEVNDPIHGRPVGKVNLRPINLNQLEKIISVDTNGDSIERQNFARKLAFGG
jgi:5-methylcytosine-specific restriction enzyme subunit McrC